MKRLEGFVLPTLVTLLLHAALLFMLSANWQPEREPPRIVPRHVVAHMVKAEQAAPKKQNATPPPPAKVEPPPKPEPKKVEPKPAPKPPEKKPEPVKKPELKPPPKPPEKPKPDPKKAQEEARRKQVEALRKQRENELAMAMKNEDDAQMAETDAQLAMAYTDAIRAAIEDNWTPPPSARHDMEVLLRIQLLPSGDVIGVSVVRGSGNDAFDLAAINAVKKAERFPEVAQAPPKVFEQHLRSFQLKFRPEDLRL